jgi:hypothetical protein
MISETSRYRDTAVETLDSDRGTHQSIVPTSPPPELYFEFTYYQLGAWDRADTLASFLYGDGTLWWMLANANPEILDWTQLKVGAIIRVPRV